MPRRVPIAVARAAAKSSGCRQVIFLGWDGERTHIVTYGKTGEDCAHAALGGNLLKQKWGWPECNDQPSRVRVLESKLEKSQTAIRDGEHVCKVAEGLMNALNEYHRQEESGEEPDTDAVSDHWRGLKSAIFEFRKRCQ